MNTNHPHLCQSCGMPLTDDCLGTNADGSKNEDYCVYCLLDGAFTADVTIEEMAHFCAMYVEEYNKHTGQSLTCCEYEQQLLQFLPTLKRWSTPAAEIPAAVHPMKRVYIDEVNALGIADLHIDNLYVLKGALINQPYDINGNEVRFFDDNATYWCNQIRKSDDRCYGIACDEKFILVSEYGLNGADAHVVMMKWR